MNIIELLLNELAQEAQNTRNMLERVPNNHYDWQPHPKSMTIRRLVTHIADLPNWITMTLDSNQLDFANNDWKEEVINDTETVLACFDRALATGTARLQQAQEEELSQRWTLRSGTHVILEVSKYEMLRITLGQIIHHRAQLGVFLRLLNVPIPGPYGPSADEMEQMAAQGTR
jgi:uncharacterized damage-inducible protein DinB